MPWSPVSVGICNLMLSPHECAEWSRNISVCLTLLTVLGTCVVSFTSVWRQRRSRARPSDCSALDVLLLTAHTAREARGTLFATPPQSVLFVPPALSPSPALTSASLSSRSVVWPSASAEASAVWPLASAPASASASASAARRSVSGAGGGPALCATPPDGRCVGVGALRASPAPDFALEAAHYRYPVELRRFVHASGARLTLVAEDLAAVEAEGQCHAGGGGEEITTEEYKRRSVERARRAAEEQQTYFRVQCDTPAAAVVTTVMEQYVCINVGPAPTATASFFLVRDGTAYTLQLQAALDDFGERLTDIFPTVQSARVLTNADPHEMHAHYVSHALRLAPESGGKPKGDGKGVCCVRLPLRLSATRSSAGDALTLRCRRVPAWSGAVITWPPKATVGEGTVGTVGEGTEGTEGTVGEGTEGATLLPGRLFVTSRWRGRAAAGAAADVRQLVAHIRAAPEDSAGAAGGGLPASRLVTDALSLPLPPIHIFETNICSHTGDPFVTLFVRDKSARVVELEIGAAAMAGAADFALLAKSLYPHPVAPRSGTTPRGKEMVTLVGSAMRKASEGKIKMASLVDDRQGEIKAREVTTLRIDAARDAADAKGVWIVVKWVYTGVSCDVPNELLRYVETVLDDSPFIKLHSLPSSHSGTDAKDGREEKV